MITRSAGRRGNEAPEKAWASWARTHKETLERATGAQQVLLEATVRFVAVIGGQPILSRAAAFFLLHAGMGLTPAQVGAAVGRTDRAMRTVQGLSAREFLESVWRELGRHRQPKLHAEHAGPIAKYLVDHPDCTQAEVVAFLAREVGIHVDPQTLRRFFKTYGLGALRAESTTAESTEAPRPFV
jgi:transposase